MVLTTLWDDGGWLTPGEVHDAVGAPRGLAYTTVMTTMSRLWEKGRVDRRHRGRAYEYRPFLDRSEYAAERMGESLANAGDSRSALAHFVEGMSTSQRAELRRVLRLRK